MKKSTKLISLILAVVMVFSASSFSALAAIPSAAQGSVDQLVQNKNLAELVGWLITNLNGAKGNITGTVLKLVYMFAGDNIGGEGKDTKKMSDEQLAKTLLDWLDANLPEWTSDLTEQSWWGTVTSIVNLLGVTLKLNSVDGILETVYSVCNKVNTDAIVGAAVGDLKGLNGSALNGVRRSGGDLKVIYALLQWINDNQQFIKSFVIGGISSSGIKLGNAVMSIIGDSLDDINKIVKNIPDFAKAWVYLLVDGYAEKPDIKDNPKGGWGTSPYKNYSADEMLAAALLGYINDTYKKSADDTLTVIPQADAQKALNLSFYGLLAEYGKPLYTRFAVNLLNKDLKEQIAKLNSIPDAKDIFKADYNFTEASFDAAFEGAKENGFLGQFNTILCTILKTMLTDKAYQAIAPKEGGNENLNENIASMCRYVLPILANHSGDLGFDFSKFTADAVKDMDLSEMAVAVLKVFFPGWFKDAYAKEPALVNNAQTIAQLGAVAMKYVVMNPDLLNWFSNGFDVKDATAKITADKIADMTDAECVDLAAEIGAKLGAYALDEQKSYTNFSLANAKADWTWKDYCDEIVDWAINFVKGFPAVAVNHITAKMGEYDGYGPFYKLNVVLNELVDFAFLSNVGDATFKLDTETLIFDTILNNAFNFDIEAIVGVFEKNTQDGNVLNGPVIKGVIGIVDRLLTALFTHTCGAAKEFTKEYTCTSAIKGSYDVKNGHYVGATAAVEGYENHDFVATPEKDVAPTCGDKGTTYYACTKCGEVKTEEIAATGKHDYQLVATDAATGTQTFQCTVCKDEYYVTPESTVPANLGDVNNDGDIKSDDARLALRASVKLEPEIVEGTDAYKAADMNGDGKVGSDDARTILRISVKLDNLDDIKANYGK